MNDQLRLGFIPSEANTVTLNCPGAPINDLEISLGQLGSPSVTGVDRGLQQAQAQKAQRDAAAAVVRQTQQRDRGRSCSVLPRREHLPYQQG